MYTGSAAVTLVRAANGDSHTPDLIGIAQPGVVYTNNVKKIAEHGGAAPADRDVALVVSGAGVPHQMVSNASVQTTQIAPSILQLLGLNPQALHPFRSNTRRCCPNCKTHQPQAGPRTLFGVRGPACVCRRTHDCAAPHPLSTQP